ncbi:hypothetical protein GCM10009566_64460 [Streptomyces murinus]
MTARFRERAAEQVLGFGVEVTGRLRGDFDDMALNVMRGAPVSRESPPRMARAGRCGVPPAP